MSGSGLKVALVSMNQQWLDKDANYLRCSEFSQIAAAQNCDLVVFPEMTLTGYSMDVAKTAELTDGSPSLQQFGKLAQDVELDIIFGACLMDSKQTRPHNVLCFADSHGKTWPTYSKIHPFTFAGEDKVFEAGNALGYVKSTGTRIGCSVCYDLRFPELYSAMASSCEAIVCIANWPVKRIFHWRALLIARAIENQLFMIGVNRTGVDGNGLEYEKSSIIVAPTGEVLVPCYKSLELDIYELDLNETSRYRHNFPTLQDRCYSHL